MIKCKLMFLTTYYLNNKQIILSFFLWKDIYHDFKF